MDLAKGLSVLDCNRLSQQGDGEERILRVRTLDLYFSIVQAVSSKLLIGTMTSCNLMSLAKIALTLVNKFWDIFRVFLLRRWIH